VQRILVTGGAGFIGSNFVHALLAEPGDRRVVVLDKLTYAGNPANLDPVRADARFEFVHGDICDAALVRDVAAGCDVVYNFAAETHVDRSIQDPQAVVWTNVRGTQVLLDVARELRLPRFVQVSTDEVYGSRAEGRFDESDPVQPSNPYSACKAAGDLLVLAAVRTYKQPALITRSSNNFGPYQHPEKLIPLHITNALEGRELPIYGDGRNVRDWIFVADNCRGIRTVGERGRDGEIYNLAGGNERPNVWIVEQIVRLTGCDPGLRRFVGDRPGHDFRYAISDAKARDLGWRPQASFEAALARTVEWYREHEAWWRPIKSGEFAAYYQSQYGDRGTAAPPDRGAR
jgi:dTDP-glucose 4,6-dehydratase